MIPAVSVLMPVRNGERWLLGALESIRAQSLGEWELIVVDDASTDGTRGILEAAHDSRVRVIQNSRPLGVAASLNKGLAMCKAPLVARHDADDTSHPRRLERQLRYVQAHPDVGVVGTNVSMVKEDGAAAGEYHVYDDHARISWSLCFGHPFAHPTVCFSRDLVKLVGGYDESYPAAQDHDLWTRLAGRTRFANLPERLVTYRVHAGGVSAARRSVQVAADIRARCGHLSAFLGRSVGRDELVWQSIPGEVAGEANMLPCHAAKGLFAYAGLILEARRAFGRRMNLNAEDVRGVDALTGRRLWNVAARLSRYSRWRAMYVAARAMLYSPDLASDGTFSRAGRRFLTRAGGLRRRA